MDTNTYLTAINAPGTNIVSVQWTTKVTGAARHKSVDLRKISTAVVQTGLDFANLSVNNDRETGDLPWGEWAMFPYVIQHKGTQYARLYTVDGTVKTTYLVNGEVVDRNTFNGYLTPSQANATRPIGGTITVKMDNLRLVGAPSFV